MAYIGAPPQNRILSSDDIAQGAVTLNDINFTDQPSNMDITGVIDKHTMRLADGVTITGDVTISDDLVLSKISDDGNAITMTNDGSSRTITGSGSIEASTLAQTPNQSLTGMTGTLGTDVFRTGQILQTLTAHKTDTETLSTSTWTAVPGMSLTIKPSSTSSKILISVSMQVAGDGSVGRYLVAGRLYRDSTAIGLATDTLYPTTAAFFVTGSQEWTNYNTHHMVNFYLDSPSTTSATTYSIKVWDTRNNGVVYINRHHYQNQSSDSPRGTSSILIQEIAG